MSDMLIPLIFEVLVFEVVVLVYIISSCVAVVVTPCIFHQNMLVYTQYTVVERGLNHQSKSVILLYCTVRFM